MIDDATGRAYYGVILSIECSLDRAKRALLADPSDEHAFKAAIREIGEMTWEMDRPALPNPDRIERTGAWRPAA